MQICCIKLLMLMIFMVSIGVVGVRAACPNGGITGTSVAVNGGFEDGFTGWTVTGGGERGSGSVYNPNWSTGTVVELDVSGNEAYSQSYTLSQGVYVLRYQYAARVTYSLATNAMKLYWNSVLIWDMVPVDYSIHTYEVYLDAVTGNNTYSIVAAGPGEGVGMTVDNVQFFHTINWNYVLTGASCVCKTGYYAPSTNAQCQLCSSQFAQCTACTLGNCTTCNVGYSGPKCCAENNCISCAFDGSSCTACDNPAGYFIDTYNNPGKCAACNLTGCLTCSTLYSCATCNNTAGYFINSISTCTLCTLTHCLTCSSLSSCGTCDTANGYFLNGTSNFCQQCSITGCRNCSSLTHCISCDLANKYYQPSTSTVCAYCNEAQNKFINGTTCQTCALEGCLKCSSLTVCSLCNTASNYKLNPATQQCHYCPIDNCNVCSSPAVCSACDVGNFYGLDAVDGKTCSLCNMSCTCSGYSLPWLQREAGCTTTCGDGFVASPTEQCDDGNNASTDGCSPDCQIEVGFECKKQFPSILYSNATNPSICGVNGFSAEAISWHENKPYFCDDRIVIQVQFIPFDTEAMKILYQQIDYDAAFTINSTAMKMEVADYNPMKGIATLTYQYSEDLYGTTIELVFNTSSIPQLAAYSPMRKIMILKDTAGPIITHPSGTCEQLQGPFGKIGAIAGGVSLGLLGICALFRMKLIALEIFLVLQVAFFSMANSSFVPALLVPLMSLREFVMGYNSHMGKSMSYPADYLANNQFLSYKVEPMGFTCQTTLNFFAHLNIMMIIAVCLPLVAMILRVSSFAIAKLAVAAQFVVKELFLTLLIYLSMGMGFVAGLHLNFERKQYQEYNATHAFSQIIKTNYFIGNLSTMTAITLVFSACVLSVLGDSEGFGEYKSQIKKEGQGPKMYITASIAFRFLMGILMAALSSNPDGSITIMVLATIFVVFIIVVQPYRDNLQNIRCLVVHICILAIIIIQLSLNSLSVNGKMRSLARNSAFGIGTWAFLGIGLAFSIGCMVVSLKQKWDKYRKKAKLREYVYNKESQEHDQSRDIMPEDSQQGFN